TGNPPGTGVPGHIQSQKLTAGILQDQKPVQQPKRDRRDHEQIHRRDAVGMIAQKGLPTPRWWLPSPRHVLRHGGLPRRLPATTFSFRGRLRRKPASPFSSDARKTPPWPPRG